MVSRILVQSIFTISTMASVGVITVSLIYAIVIMFQLSMAQYDSWIIIIALLILLISIFLLGFGIWASISGGKCAKLLMSIFYLIFSGFSIFMGSVLIDKKEEIISSIENIYGDDDSQRFQPDTAAQAIENMFECCGFKIIVERCQNGSSICMDAINEFYETHGIPISGCILALGIFIILISIFTFYFSCMNSDFDDYQEVSGNVSYIGPISFGW